MLIERSCVTCDNARACILHLLDDNEQFKLWIEYSRLSLCPDQHIELSYLMAMMAKERREQTEKREYERNVIVVGEPENNILTYMAQQQYVDRRNKTAGMWKPKEKKKWKTPRHTKDVITI